MQISIIIPIYKVEKYIERCIKSVITQTFTDYEVILVDDKSPDNALQIAEKLLTENNIEFQTIKHEKNKGLSEARNSGLKVAKGKYIMFIDSDDELAHNKVLSSFYAVVQKDNYDFVTANLNVIYNPNEIAQPQWGKGIEKDEVLYDDAILESFLERKKLSVFAWNKLINKDFLIENKLFFKKGIVQEDELWCFQMCIVAKKCYLLSETCYSYESSNINSITKNKNKNFYDDKLFIMKEQLNTITIKMGGVNHCLSIIYKDTGKVCVQTNTFVCHYKRLSLSVLRPIYSENKNKEWWVEYYQKIREMYKDSKLYSYKKLFILPPKMAYFIFSEQRHPSYIWLGKKYYKKLMKLFNRYNLG